MVGTHSFVRSLHSDRHSSMIVVPARVRNGWPSLSLSTSSLSSCIVIVINSIKRTFPWQPLIHDLSLSIHSSSISHSTYIDVFKSKTLWAGLGFLFSFFVVVSFLRNRAALSLNDYGRIRYENIDYLSVVLALPLPELWRYVDNRQISCDKNTNKTSLTYFHTRNTWQEAV